MDHNNLLISLQVSELKQLITETVNSCLAEKKQFEKVGLKSWVTEKEAQDLLGKRTTSLWRLRSEGLISSSKIGARTFYNLDSINQYLERNSK